MWRDIPRQLQELWQRDRRAATLTQARQEEAECAFYDGDADPSVEFIQGGNVILVLRREEEDAA